jgi:uncharacterized peroxidase-related enzyme
MSSEFSPDVAQVAALERNRVPPSSTNLSLVDEHTASEEVRALLAHYREHFSRTQLPGILLCFATNPALLNGMLEIAKNFLFGESLLSRRNKEMIATYVSRLNACPYCAGSHGALLGLESGSPEMICALEDDDLNAQLFTRAELALLKFAGTVNSNSSTIARADIEAAMCAGWTEAQVAEAVHIAALFAAFNRIANSFGLPSPYPDDL